ncbi:MAG: hypothetical protein M1820_004799 [Bogoriella megaspora]|nr:MAG: hypothetical protein M1820_004799 [Bogoriella megaspora]
MKILAEGNARLSSHFLWLAGKVVNKDGTFKIEPLGESIQLATPNSGMECFNIDYASLAQKDFPFSMLDESILATRDTLTSTDESVLDWNVFIIQANFIDGGLLLTFQGQHGSMDLAGQSEVIRLFGKACRNEPFTPSELSNGNTNRESTIPLLDESSYSAQLQQQTPNEAPTERTQSRNDDSAHLNLSWAYFSFSSTSLAALKSIAMETVPSGSFVSTDDTLSAYIWLSISRARLPRLGSRSELISTLARAVDVRRMFSIPSTYPGMVAQSTFCTSVIDGLVQQPLGTIATDLRSRLGPESLRQQTCASATAISRHEEIGFALSSIPDLDVRLSSWAKESSYDIDFGFGKPQAVRRPRFAKGAREGLAYFLPKNPHGEIVVGLCLRAEDLEELKGDVDFAKFGRYIG